MNSNASPLQVAIVGAGPAGLMAAEVLSRAGVVVHVFDAMPSVGRKFLLAGLGGLNLTHAENWDAFVSRFGERAEACAAWFKTWDNQAIRAWAQGLGIETGIDLEALVDAGAFISQALGRPPNSRVATAVLNQRAA